jgi:4-amino-4-deoxy-L-arabinose transferase-like glycosyltransferase
MKIISRTPAASGLALLLLLYTLLNGAVVLLVNIHHDEGWYLYASNLVYQRQLPYRDFAFFQMPLLPYIYGSFQWLVGPSILIGRLTSLLFSVASAGLSMVVARRLAGNLAAAITGLCLLTSGDFLRVGSYANNVVLGTFFAVLGSYLLIRAEGRLPLTLLAVLSWICAGLSRLSFGPAAAVSLLVAAWSQRQSLKNLILIGLAALVTLGLTTGSVLLTTFDAAVFNNLTAQLTRLDQFEATARPASTAVTGPTYLGFLLLYLPATVLTGLLGALHLSKIGARNRRPLPPDHVFLAVLVPLVFLPNLLPGNVYPTYLAASYPFLAILAGVLGQRLLHARFISSRVLFTLVSLICLLSSALSILYLSAIISLRPSGLAQLQSVTALVQALSSPQRELLTFETSLAVNAERRLTTGTAMSYFSYFPKLDTGTAQKYHLVNAEIIRRQLRQEEVGLVALTDFDVHLLRDPLNSSRARPEPLTWPELVRYFPEFDGRYQLATVIPNYGEWHSHLYLIQPKTTR